MANTQNNQALATQSDFPNSQVIKVPLNQLVIDELNTRQEHNAQFIKSLAADIENKGVLQNLCVRKLSSENYGVVAGGARLTALNLLVSVRRHIKWHRFRPGLRETLLTAFGEKPPSSLKLFILKNHNYAHQQSKTFQVLLSR